jgi:hypothetical protein
LRAVAHLAGDPDLERPAVGARDECVELAVEPVDIAAEDRGDLATTRIGEMLPGLLELLRGVEQCAVVDADGVGVLVLDDGAVDERPNIPERLVVQVARGDPLGDRLGELRGDLVHVGELVGHRHRDVGVLAEPLT